MKRLSDLFGRYSLPNVMGRLGHSIGGMFHHDGNTGIVPPGQSYYPVTQVPGLTQSPYTGGSYGTSNPFTNPNVGGSTPSSGQGSGGISDPFGGQFNGWQGGASSGFTGNSSGGTLGGGHALDPSQWGGLFDSDAGNSVPYHTQYATGVGESGGRGDRQLLPQWQAMAQQHQMHTGGNGPSYDSSGINPGGMYTGGNLPAQQGGMTTGGNYPAQAMPTVFGRLGGKQPPGGLMR